MKKSEEKRISELYGARLKEDLPDYKVAGWGSRESQYLRFEVLAEINKLAGMKILDVGCGLGELYYFFKNNQIRIDSYKGIDISEECINEARNRIGVTNQVSFDCINIEKIDGENLYDYVFLSGALNLRIEDNLLFAKNAISKMYSLCKKGVACNFLSTRVDYTLEKDYHYSPEEVLSFCKEISNRVILRQDYPLYEFTVYIYKD